MASGRPARVADSGRTQLPNPDLASGREELVKNPEVGWVLSRTFRLAVTRSRSSGIGRPGPDQRRSWVLSWPGREARFVAPNLWPVGWSGNGDGFKWYQASTRTVVRVSPRTSKIEPVGSFPQGALEGGDCGLNLIDSDCLRPD